MKFFQHIYGRVSRGYQNFSPGYQLAALSDGLQNERELIDNLNKYSFFNFRYATENDYRISFFQPTREYVAFGVSHFAKDNVGALGSFAHNLVCSVDEYVNSDWTPAEILKAFTFFIKNEDELPEDRTLPEIDLLDKVLTEMDEKWNELALYIMNMIMSKTISLPMVVQPEKAALMIMQTIFRQLPRVETMRFSFSTLFIDSLNFTHGFRLVFIPESKFIPSGSPVFDIIQNQSDLSIRKSNSYTRMALSTPQRVRDFVNLADVLRHRSTEIESKETKDSLSVLMQNPKTFRENVEFLKLPNIYRAILQNSSWFTEYYKAGTNIAFEGEVEELVCINQDDYLETILNSANQLSGYPLKPEIIKRLIYRTLSGIETVKPEILKKTGNLGTFYEKANDLLDIRDLVSLTDRIKESNLYENELHYFIAAKMLMADWENINNHFVKCMNWLILDVKERKITNHFIKCVIELTSKIVGHKGLSDISLSAYRLNSDEYKRIVRVIVRLSLKPYRYIREDILLSMTFIAEEKGVLLPELISNLDLFRNPREILHELIVKYPISFKDISNMISAIKTSENAADYASYLQKVLMKYHKLDPQLHEELKKLEGPGRFWGFK